MIGTLTVYVAFAVLAVSSVLGGYRLAKIAGPGTAFLAAVICVLAAIVAYGAFVSTVNFWALGIAFFLPILVGGLLGSIVSSKPSEAIPVSAASGFAAFVVGAVAALGTCMGVGQCTPF